MRPLHAIAPQLLSAMPLDTFTIAEYDFDDSMGKADTQGWLNVDVTDQTIFFHVDDFAGMPSPYAPLNGNQSMWLGVRASSAPPFCSWIDPPGYGNLWRQELKSVEFPVTGDVTISYEVRWDSESSYDQTRVQYRSSGGNWLMLPVNGGAAEYDGTGTLSESFVIPAANHSGSMQFRFFFSSDGAASDEDIYAGFDSDGAIVLDDLLISDGSGVVDSQNFESEALGQTTTSDGDWSAGCPTAFGNHTALFDGSKVLQEDPVVTNNTNLWAFIDNSPDNLSCGGFPAQRTVPGPIPSDLPFISTLYFTNEIHSPFVDITQDQDGMPMPSSAPIIVEFDAYRDLPLNTGVRYQLRVRSVINGCPGQWRATPRLYGADKQWFRHSFDVTSWVDPSATEVQIAIRCLDEFTLPDDPCHTQAPLIDNVRIVRTIDVATGVGDSPFYATSLEQNHPNPFNPTTTIRYTIAEPSHVRLRVYSVSGALVRTLVDSKQTPQNDPFTVTWDGYDNHGGRVATGVYLYRLETGAFAETRKMVLLK